MIIQHGASLNTFERGLDLDRTVVHKINRNTLLSAVSLESVYWVCFLLSVMTKCFYFQFTTRLNVRPYFSTGNLYMLLSTLGILFVLIAPVSAVFNRRRLVALFVCNVIFSALLTADTNFFRYYYNILSIPVIMQVNFKLLSSVDQSIISLFKIKDIIYIIDLPVMLAGLIFLQKKGIPPISFKRRLAAAILLLCVGFSVFFAIFRNADIQAFSYNNNYVAGSLGVFYSHFDSTRILFKERFLESKNLSKKEKAALDSFFNFKRGHSSTVEPIGGRGVSSYLNQRRVRTGENYKGLARGKNLIVVQVEALQQFVINRKVNGNEITPNLNALIRDSLYFDNFYFQVAGGNTSDAEFLCNTSLYPDKYGAVYIRYPENTYYSLPKELKDLGYHTYALHGFNPEFWNRQQMYKALGFDTFVNCNDYVMDEFAGWEGKALSDSSFFRQSFDKIDMTRPFYSFFITLSSHHPFNDFEKFSFDTGKLEGGYLSNYLKAAHFADRCLGEFISELKKRGMYDNTLLVIYGDHSAVPKHQANELMGFLNLAYSDLTWSKLQKVPCIIHYPGLKNGEVVSITGGEIDLYPTIANLMDLKAPFSLGKDLLNSESGYVVLRNGSVITDDYIYLNNTRAMYDMKSGKPLKWRDYKPELHAILNELSISDLIIEKNAFEEK